MNTNRLTLEFTGPRRRSSAWHRYLGCALWIIMGLVMLAWVMWAAWHAEDPTRSVPMLRGGFPDWVAFGIVGTLVLTLIGHWAWMAICGPRVDEEAMEQRLLRCSTSAPSTDWMPCLVEWFARRQVMLSRGQAVDICRICVPDHTRALVELDHYLRTRLRLKLFMSSLMEVQQICLRSEPEDVVITGKEGAWS